ncbi:FAD:protein FMN transferase [Streptomyces sp. L7]
MTEVLDLCEQYRLATGGAFDVRLPGRPLDPCAVVKGWSVQRAAELLTAAGARRFILNAGGDVVVSGGPWRVGVRHPEHADQLCTVLELTDGAVATSAWLRTRRPHRRRPHRPPRRPDWPGLSVVAASLTEADATATAALAMGPEGVDWAAARPGCEVFAVDAERRARRTPGFPVATVAA